MQYAARLWELGTHVTCVCSSMHTHICTYMYVWITFNIHTKYQKVHMQEPFPSCSVNSLLILFSDIRNCSISTN